MKYLLLTLVILVLGHIGLGVMHEQVHVAIFNSYGIEATVDYYGSFPDMVTHGQRACPTEECQLAHHINEVVGYHLTVFYFVFAFLIFSCIMYLELNLNLKEQIYKNSQS